MIGRIRNQAHPQSVARRPRGQRLASTTALCVGLCAIVAAPALAITQDEADTLRADIETFLADPGDATVDWEAAGFSFRSGTVSVAILGGSFEILIPGLVVVYDEPESNYGFGEPEHVEIALGDLRATLTPDQIDEDLFKLVARFGDGGSTRFTITAEERATIDIGSHALDGVWSSEFGYFVSGGIVFNDIVAMPDRSQPDAPDARVTVGLLSSSSDLTEVEPGRWDGGADIVIENLVAEEKGEALFSLGRFALYEVIGGFAFDDYVDFVANNPIMTGMTPEDMPEEEAEETFRQAIVDFPALLDDFTIGWTLDDLEGGEPDERVLIDHHEFEFAMLGLAGDTSEWRLRALVTGVTIPEDPEVPPQFVPGLVDFDLSFANVPTGLAWQAMEQAVATTPISDLDEIGPLLGQQMMQLVMQAQTGMTLDGEIDWQTGNVALDGEVRADPSSPLLVGGSLAIVVREMQEFIREVDAAAGPEAASMLTFLQSMGQQEDGDQGLETVFEFEVSGNNVLMNGQDLEPIVQMLSR